MLALLHRTWSRYDADNSGTLSFREFSAAFLHKHQEVSQPMPAEEYKHPHKVYTAGFDGEPMDDAELRHHKVCWRTPRSTDAPWLPRWGRGYGDMMIIMAAGYRLGARSRVCAGCVSQVRVIAVAPSSFIREACVLSRTCAHAWCRVMRV